MHGEGHARGRSCVGRVMGGEGHVWEGHVWIGSGRDRGVMQGWRIMSGWEVDMSSNQFQTPLGRN